MSYLAAAVLALGLAAPNDAPRVAHTVARIEAQAYDAARSPAWAAWRARDIAALVVAVQYHESGRFALTAFDGTRRGDAGQSVCNGQINSTAWYAPGFRRAFGPTWAGVYFPEGLLGDAGEDNCIRATLTVLELWHPDRRRPDVQGVAELLTGYGTGRTSRPQAWVWPRVRTWQTVSHVRQHADDDRGRAVLAFAD